VRGRGDCVDTAEEAMTPDPNAQEQFEELLKDDSGVVVPPSSSGGEPHKLHVLTALLNKYKAVIRPPATARREAADYEAKIQRVMRLTEGIRPEPSPQRSTLNPQPSTISRLRDFLSFDWARPAVLVPVVACALVVVGLTLVTVINRQAHKRNTLLVLSCIPAESVAQQFILRGGATSQVRSAEVTSAVLGAVSDRFPAGAVTNRYTAAETVLSGPAEKYPADVLQHVTQRFVILVVRVPKAEGSQLELRLYDTSKKALVLAKKIEASDPDELREAVKSGAKSLLHEGLPRQNR